MFMRQSRNTYRIKLMGLGSKTLEHERYSSSFAEWTTVRARGVLLKAVVM